MKIINILIGPKGSGKTFIGLLLQEKLNVPFLRTESLFLQIKSERNYLDTGYIRDGFALVEKEIRNILAASDEVIIESTGAAPQFDEMLGNLRKQFHVRLIKISADLDKCLERVKIRDKSIHIDVSDDNITMINKLSVSKQFHFDFEIDNNIATAEELLKQFSKFRENS
jgi:shikimate kinase